MKHYGDLDLSAKETSICIVVETGKVRREAKVVTPSRGSYPGAQGSGLAARARRPRSQPVVAVAFPQASGGGFAGRLHRDPAYVGLQLVEDLPNLAGIMTPLLEARRTLREQVGNCIEDCCRSSAKTARAGD